MVYGNGRKSILVFDGCIARHLLRQGYQIIDVKPDKRNRIKSVFVFRYEKGIEDSIADLSDAELF